MLAKAVLSVCSAFPGFTRPLLRLYLRQVGWVPARAQWALAELKRRLIPPQSVRWVSLGSGLQLEIDLANGMGQEIYYHGAHEPGLSTFLDRFLKPGMTVLDVGANIGEVTLQAARRVGEGGRVYAVEVSPQTLPRLKRNIALNRLANVEVVEAAVCDRDEPVTFYLGQGADSGSSSLSQPHNYTGEWVTVPGVRLDTLATAQGLDRIDCIKLDIEGAELAALRGCTGLLSGPHPPAVVFEYHADVAGRMGWALADMHRVLASCGYTMRQLDSESWNNRRINVLAIPPALAVAGWLARYKAL